MYRPTKGLAQGSTVSRSLFNIYLDDFLAECSVIDMFVLAFVDDLVVVANDENGITVSIRSFDKFCKKNQVNAEHS